MTVPTQAVLTVQGVSKAFGGQPVLDDASLTVHQGDRVGLIGRNGSGKSTLLKIMAGSDTPDEGFVTRQRGLSVVMLEQETVRNDDLTVGDVLDEAQGDVRARLERFGDLTRELADIPVDDPRHAGPAVELTALEHELSVTDAWDIEQDVKRVMVGLDLPDRARVLATLSGGERRRLDLAAAVVRRPGLLLLDEPTNHIDVTSVGWIEGFLAAYPGGCVLVTHDRYFLDRIVNRIVELDACKLAMYPGSYAGFLERKSILEKTEMRAETARRGLMRRELAWLRQGARARTTKQKARIARFDVLEAAGTVRQKAPATFEIPQSRKLSKRVLEAENISRAHGSTVLFRDLSLIMQRSMRVGIVGPNGCGKTTLLRVLMGHEEPDTGSVVQGDATEFLYVDQCHEEVHPETSVLQHVTAGTKDLDFDGRRFHVPSYLERFLFDRRSIEMPMQNLSGGERNRIDLAKKLLRGGNFLVFDEPTNDLDLATLRLLEEAVLSFDGCAFIVSHDRYFLNRLCTHLLAFEDDGHVAHVAGNYDDYLLQVERRPAPEAAPEERQRPTRTRAPRQRRLTWNEKQELAGIEQAIRDADAELARLDTAIADPGLYRRGHKAAQDVVAAHDEAVAHVKQLYDRWAELEAIVENA